ncbi:MAG TPA: serine/threonine-protein kinase [Gemmatimonadales bacterium]|nr:serine/threonine-protein kinase [Gemmatimonadales bacterium]
MQQDVKVGELLDQYRITGQIARGGMAAIYKAVDRLTGATVAIKIPFLRFESDPTFHARFVREEEIGRRLSHPNVVRVLKPRQKSRLYIVTEYVNGAPLRSLMKHGEPLDQDRALAIARQIAEAVVYLHGQHVVHRDLKPQNILVTPDGKIKIVDFGIALDHPGRRLTWLGSDMVGTPEYMAPEQAKGLRGDERSDIYALGLILYEMLTGRLPYSGETPQDFVQSKLGSDPIPPTKFRPDLHPVLEEIILHAIERMPGKRYATAAEMLADLQDPTRVRPVGRRERLDPTSIRTIRVRRRVTQVVLAVLTLVALGMLVWLANRFPASAPKPLPPPRAAPAH